MKRMKMIKYLDPVTREVIDIKLLTPKEFELHRKFGERKSFVFCRNCAHYNAETDPMCSLWFKLSHTLSEDEREKIRRNLHTQKLMNRQSAVYMKREVINDE